MPFAEFLPDNQSYLDYYDQQADLNKIYQLICHCIPVLTFPIYLEAFYCIFYKCKQFSPKYVTLLKIHMLLHFIGEIHWTVLLLPVPILPGICISATGLLSAFDVSASWQLFAMCGILNISTATMIHLLIYRLKFAIPPDASHLRVVKLAADLANVLFYVTAIFCTCVFGLLSEDQIIVKNRLVKKFLVPPPNFFAPNYVAADQENPFFKFFLYATCAEILVFSVNIISVPSFSFYYLAQNRTEKSEKVAAAHRKTLRTLIFQLAVHCIFHLLPLVCFTSSVILKNNNVYYIGLGLGVWALHGAACTFTLVLANGPFRETFRSHVAFVCCCLCFKSQPRSEEAGKRRESTIIHKIDITN